MKPDSLRLAAVTSTTVSLVVAHWHISGRTGFPFTPRVLLSAATTNSSELKYWVSALIGFTGKTFKSPLKRTLFC